MFGDVSRGLNGTSILDSGPISGPTVRVDSSKFVVISFRVSIRLCLYCNAKKYRSGLAGGAQRCRGFRGAGVHSVKG
jgi:hypothetical protein